MYGREREHPIHVHSSPNGSTYVNEPAANVVMSTF